MQGKPLGIVLIILGLLLGGVVYLLDTRQSQYVDLIVEQQNGSCFLEDGTCLHDAANSIVFIVGWVVAAVLLVLGGYFVVVAQDNKMLVQQQEKVTQTLQQLQKHDEKKLAFDAFLGGFSVEEQRVLRVVQEEPGIEQSTLRYKTGMAKTTLSLLLQSLEQREIITRKPSGKTNKVFLRKKF
ncbi:MAG: hypothetical protein Q7R96_04570 [Nanoarchaeota archaeon]|nr:hypothetical protein [Nanoarchaeota archaeon]